MKKIFLTAVLATVLLALQVPAAASTPIESNAQYEAQISFFKDALDRFGATDPDQAVRLWAHGDETRNGVFKYAVAGRNLKLQLIDRWGKPEKNFWIIGVSSPWLSRYTIENKVVKSPTVIEYTVKYFWQTSAGPSSPTVEKLYVIKYQDNWFIDKAVALGSVS